MLHDAIEWYDISEDVVRKEFGDHIADSVRASTKDDSIKDPVDKIEKMICACVEAGEAALIVKTADILDSYKWYARTGNDNELIYCARNRDAILRLKPDGFRDRIFDELNEIRDAKSAPTS